MFVTPKEESLGGVLGRALGSVGASRLGAWQEEKKRQQKAAALQKFMGSPEYKNMPLAQKASMTTMLFGPDVGKTVIEQEKLQQQERMQQARLEQHGFLPENADERADIIQKYTGMSVEDARKASDFYDTLTTGGKTAFTKSLLEKEERGEFGRPRAEGPPTERRAPVIEGPPAEPLTDLGAITEEETESFEWPKYDNFEGLKKGETVSRQNQYRKENVPIYKASSKKLSTVEADLLRTGTLTRLNERGNLPEGLGRWKVHPQTGKLILPAGANADTQYFAKVINDFTRGIKERFGARITNFEIDIFLRSLPSLANTNEGRKMILKHMELMTKMEKLHESSLKEAYRKYGMQNIDAAQADQVAEDLAKSKMDELKIQYSQIAGSRNDLLAQRDERALVEIDGKRGYVPFSQLEEAKKRGAKIITSGS